MEALSHLSYGSIQRVWLLVAFGLLKGTSDSLRYGGFLKPKRLALGSARAAGSDYENEALRTPPCLCRAGCPLCAPQHPLGLPRCLTTAGHSDVRARNVQMVESGVGCGRRTRTSDLRGYEPGELPLLYPAITCPHGPTTRCVAPGPEGRSGWPVHGQFGVKRSGVAEAQCHTTKHIACGPQGGFGHRAANSDSNVRIWWRRTGSNRRPSACKADALPTELRPHENAEALT